jgi:hypothetical protein
MAVVTAIKEASELRNYRLNRIAVDALFRNASQGLERPSHLAYMLKISKVILRGLRCHNCDNLNIESYTSTIDSSPTTFRDLGCIGPGRGPAARRHQSCHSGSTPRFHVLWQALQGSRNRETATRAKSFGFGKNFLRSGSGYFYPRAKRSSPSLRDSSPYRIAHNTLANWVHIANSIADLPPVTAFPLTEALGASAPPLWVLP